RETNCSERHLVKDMVVMLAPFAPHFSEECWERLGGETTVFSARWPVWDERLTVEDMMEIPVQVNGKTRGKVRVPRGAEEAAIVAAAMEQDAVKRFTEGKELRKQIYVPGRLLNLVVG
ncbi:MAG: class I tRNA ligase family protein, partial [Gemmatimonadales bacterium]